ncbi:hypothetical protein AX774_g56 [Zancudomyces culisetae]|uniref:Uncharacterized protein n=1 Tax=Zancudomyces culisetae TaxID=1213189 RepID=A0A1R1PZK2_ZANCU|nr:hypothetical protein AX774_g56 [Zancudomyces culisetae]|eukprot:OMH86370.1 hypothetical protein AX774_g56 [Zancudomyces culisetae]
MEQTGSTTKRLRRGKRTRKIIDRGDADKGDTDIGDNVGGNSNNTCAKFDSTSKWTLEYVTCVLLIGIIEYISLYVSFPYNTCRGDKKIDRYRDYMGKKTFKMTKNEFMRKLWINETQYEELTKNNMIKPNYNDTDAAVAEAILTYYVVLVDGRQAIYDNEELILENIKTNFSDEQLFGVNSELLNKSKENFIEFCSLDQAENIKLRNILSLPLIEFYVKVEESYIRSKSEIEKINEDKDIHKIMWSPELDDLEIEYNHINGSKKSILTLLNSRVKNKNEMIQLMNEADKNDTYQCILPTLRAMTGNKKDEKVIDDYVKSILGIFSFNRNNEIMIGGLNFTIRSSSISIASGVDVMLYDKGFYKGNLIIEDKIHNSNIGDSGEAQLVGKMIAHYIQLFTIQGKLYIENCKQVTIYGVLFTGFIPTIYKITFNKETLENILENQKKHLNGNTPTRKLPNLVSQFVLFDKELDLIKNPGARNYTYYVLELLRRIVLFDSNAYIVCNIVP